MGECRDCRFWTPTTDVPHWGVCGLAHASGYFHAGRPGDEQPLHTRESFGCQVYQPRPVAPVVDWRVVAQRRQEALVWLARYLDEWAVAVTTIDGATCRDTRDLQKLARDLVRMRQRACEARGTEPDPVPAYPAGPLPMEVK